MALIKCYECSKEISDTAASCPYCGAPTKKIIDNASPENKKSRPVGILLIIGIVFVPIIFVWFLLRKGYSTKARAIGFGYFVLSIVWWNRTLPDTEPTSSSYESSQSAKERQTDSRPSADVLNTFSAQQLSDEYDENTVAADIKYKNKWFLLEGTVSEISTDILNEPYVSLSVENEFSSPQLKFNKSEESSLAGLKSGYRIKAQCLGAGDIIKTPMLKECTLLRGN